MAVLRNEHVQMYAYAHIEWKFLRRGAGSASLRSPARAANRSRVYSRKSTWRPGPGRNMPLSSRARASRICRRRSSLTSSHYERASGACLSSAGRPFEVLHARAPSPGPWWMTFRVVRGDLRLNLIVATRGAPASPTSRASQQQPVGSESRKRRFFVFPPRFREEESSREKKKTVSETLRALSVGRSVRWSPTILDRRDKIDDRAWSLGSGKCIARSLVGCGFRDRGVYAPLV